jgi:hypothetical protein
MKPDHWLRTLTWRWSAALLVVAASVLAVAQPGAAGSIEGFSTAWSLVGSAGVALLATVVMFLLAMRRPKTT